MCVAVNCFFFFFFCRVVLSHAQMEEGKVESFKCYIVSNSGINFSYWEGGTVIDNIGSWFVGWLTVFMLGLK